MKKIIITGASDGLGKELGKICVENNIEVVCISRTKPDYKAVHIKTDLANEKSIINCANEIKKNHPKFDALVNCAGLISIQKANVITYKELENLMKVNSLAPIFLTSQLFDLTKENEADIMNVGSTVGTKAYADQSAYGTSKWGLRGTSKNLQIELKNTKCRVIQFNPGGMNTNFFGKYKGNNESYPDMMKPKDIAEVMFYILSLPKQLEVSEILINRKKV